MNIIKQSLKDTKQQLINSIPKLLIFLSISIILISPILHQNIKTTNINNLNYKCYFSILDSIEADFDNKDFETGYFVKNVLSK